jgi:hypothetical protein
MLSLGHSCAALDVALPSAKGRKGNASKPSVLFGACYNLFIVTTHEPAAKVIKSPLVPLALQFREESPHGRSAFGCIGLRQLRY